MPENLISTKYTAEIVTNKETKKCETTDIKELIQFLINNDIVQDPDDLFDDDDFDDDFDDDDLDDDYDEWDDDDDDDDDEEEGEDERKEEPKKES